MAAIHRDEFKRDAVRIAPTSGLTRRQVGLIWGLGIRPLANGSGCLLERPRCQHRTPGCCARTNGCAKRTAYCGFQPDRKTLRGTVVRRTEGSVKTGGDVLRGSKAMKFQYIADDGGSLTRHHLCRLTGVTDRGPRAWKQRSPSHRQRRDMVLLAPIRDQHRLSPGSYGRPRMTEELNELGLRVGQRRVGRLMRQNGIQVMRQNGIQVVRSRKFKRSTDSDHLCNIAPNLLQQDFTASGPNQKWAGDITSVRTREGRVCLALAARQCS